MSLLSQKTKVRRGICAKNGQKKSIWMLSKAVMQHTVLISRTNPAPCYLIRIIDYIFARNPTAVAAQTCVIE